MKVNRWTIATSLFAISWLLSAAYIYSNYVIPLMEEFGVGRAEASLPASLGAILSPVLNMLGGILLDRRGPRFTFTFGGAIMGIGYTLCGFANSISTLIAFYVIHAAGLSICYISLLPTAVRWFPDRRAFISGFTTIGLGLGALVLSPLATIIILTSGWRMAFIYIGLTMIVAITALAQVLRSPPSISMPLSSPSSGQKQTVHPSQDFTPRAMVRTWQFYCLWIIFFCGTLGGSTLFGHLAPLLVEAGFTRVEAALAVSFLSLACGICRPFAGYMADKIGEKVTLASLYVVAAVFMFCMVTYPMLAFVWVLFIGIGHGQNFAIFPSITAGYYGLKHMGVNYAVMLTAVGISACVGPLFAGWVYDTFKSYYWSLIIAIISYIVGAILAIIVRKPQPAEKSVKAEA